ncbi:unnamed protein product [Sphagnum compactum]
MQTFISLWKFINVAAKNGAPLKFLNSYSGVFLINRVPRSKDKLMLQGTQFWWCLGVYNKEMKIGHKLLVDVDAWSDLENAGSSDELDHLSLYG